MQKFFSVLSFIAEKMLVPIALGILAYVTASTSNQIADNQADLAEKQFQFSSQLETKQFQFSSQLETKQFDLKVMEIFFEHILSQDKNRQRSSVELLPGINPDTRARLISMITTGGLQVEEDTRERVDEVSARLVEQVTMGGLQVEEDTRKRVEQIARTVRVYASPKPIPLDGNKIKIEWKDSEWNTICTLDFDFDKDGVESMFTLKSNLETEVNKVQGSDYRYINQVLHPADPAKRDLTLDLLVLKQTEFGRTEFTYRLHLYYLVDDKGKVIAYAYSDVEAERELE